MSGPKCDSCLTSPFDQVRPLMTNNRVPIAIRVGLRAIEENIEDFEVAQAPLPFVIADDVGGDPFASGHGAGMVACRDVLQNYPKGRIA